jgi:sugar/nucleoside kinase (ribokinase family)
MSVVLALGYLSIDRIVTPSGVREGVPGGAALYAALGARAMGARAAIAACIGEDYPATWIDAMGLLGIDTLGLVRHSGATRRVRLIHEADGGRRSGHDVAWWERTTALAPPLPPLGDAAILVAAPMPVRSLAALLDHAEGRPVVADTSEAFAAREGEAILALVPRLAAFAPSREETRLLLPHLDDDEAAESLARLGPAVLQKRGPSGALAVEAGGGARRTLPAPPAARVVDPTGAGDAVVGALAARLAKGAPFPAAAEAALSVGALAVSRIGPAGLGLDLTPLEERRRA